ncbi:MAG: HDIG domain-containing metalloprotein [archaeon]
MIPTEEQCMSIHKREGTPENVIEHCISVRNYAKTLAEKIGPKLKINLPALLAAALLHDIARARSEGPHHGVVGAAIVRSYGVDEEICKMIERHLGSGIDDEEAAKIGLPAGKIYMPLTMEERLLSYADKRIFPGGIATHEEVIDSFRKEFGECRQLENLKKLLEEVGRLCS